MYIDLTPMDGLGYGLSIRKPTYNRTIVFRFDDSLRWIVSGVDARTALVIARRSGKE
jgi:hypothetical protein